MVTTIPMDRCNRLGRGGGGEPNLGDNQIFVTEETVMIDGQVVVAHLGEQVPVTQKALTLFV